MVTSVSKCCSRDRVACESLKTNFFCFQHLQEKRQPLRYSSRVLPTRNGRSTERRMASFWGSAGSHFVYVVLGFFIATVLCAVVGLWYRAIGIRKLRKLLPKDSGQ